MSRPHVAVVIPTSRRETRLAFALEALADQTVEPERFEVVVVRDPRPGPLTEAPPGLAVRFLTRPPGTGTAAARNLGWRATDAPMVAFTDDDCRPAPGWLEAILAAGAGRDRFLQGRTEPDPDERHLLGGMARSQEVTEPSLWYPTCNMAYPRALLESLDGFDESYFFGGEDTDLALRAEEAGARPVYLDGALVWHAVHLRHLGQALAMARAWRFLPRLLKRHPRQRAALRWRFFWKRSHAWLALWLAGLVVGGPRSPLAAAAGAPYLGHRLRPFVTRNGVGPRALAAFCVRFPPQLAVDLTEVAVTMREAARHRVPVI